MDSTLLAGAYSKRYKYIDREHIECLKTYSNPEQDDVLAKARRLSQETNKRRKVAAQKRKQEQEREEKRRQEILNKRHQEQKQATEKYQRSHVGARPRHSPTRRNAHSPRRTHSHMDLDEALRLVRGSSAPSLRNPDAQSRETIQRMYQQQENARDPLDRSHQVRTRRSRSASRHGQHQGHNKHRPLSGNPLDTSMRSELMERSMRNLTSSRSRFEQQLEHHQQLLVEQQQKSLHEFNQAIRKEIDSDTKVQGLEDQTDDDDHDGPQRSESLSSLDSLEEEEGGENQSLLPNSKQQDHQDLRAFYQAAEQQRDQRRLQVDYSTTGQTHGRGGTELEGYQECQHQSTVRPQSAKAPAEPKGQVEIGGNGGSMGHAHIVGPIPQGYYTQAASASSTPVILGNLSQCPDSLDASPSSPERRVGTALRLPQQQPPTAPTSHPIKQAPPALQYNSQLLAHRQFEPRPNYSSTNVGSKQLSGGGDGGVDTGGVTCGSNPSSMSSKPSGMTVNPPATEQPTSALTQNEHPWERPKAHIYAWTSPPPVEDEQEAGWIACNGHTDKQVISNYSEEMVADRVIATNLHPHSNRSISTAATTTWIYQTVNPAPNREPAFSQANGSTTHSNQTSSGTHVEIPRGQGQKPGGSAAGIYQACTGIKFVASMPQSLQGHQQSSDNRQHGQVPENQSQGRSQYGREQSGSASQQHQQQQREGSISQGMLSVVNGRLTVVDIGQPKITVVEEELKAAKEVRGILKKANRTAQSPAAPAGQKFNVQDSLEIAKKHMQQNAETKRVKVKRKGVRFADLHYADAVDEDTDSIDSMTEASLAAAAKDGSGDGKPAASNSKSTPQRQRPASARTTSTIARMADSNKVKGPRVASAGPSAKPTQASRPKAAAHIIMSGETISHPYHHGNDAGTGITVHKSQLEKKVMLINNNFMSRIPTYSTASTAATVSSTTSGTTAAHAVPSTGAGNSAINTSAANTYKTYSCNQAGDAGKSGKTSSAPSPQQTTVLPSHSHFSNANNNSYKIVYNENGMRIDRTPTDDEINSLWKNMRTMLDVSDKGATSQPSSTTATNTTSNSSNNSDTAAKSQAHVSHQYMDGASLGIPNGMNRVGSVGFATTATKTSPPVFSGNGTGPKSGGGAMPQPSKNGYLQRYSLLQQRRNVVSGIGTTARTNSDVVEQTVQPMNQISSNGTDPWHAAVSISYAPRGEEMSESMAGFLAAEQLVHTQGADVRESKVLSAMESAQNQQEMYNSVRQKMARGGPSALSMEEHRLLESLDKLNERLNAVENRAASGQNGNNHSTMPSNHQVYVHGPGFRGHQVIQRRTSAGASRPSGRPVSARLSLTRPHH